MKCPYCNEEIEKLGVGFGDMPMEYRCKNPDCAKKYGDASIKVWEDLIKTKQTLEQSETCCTEWEKQALDYKAENIALSGELECTRKALNEAIDTLCWYDNNYDSVVARNTLDEIRQITENPAENVQTDTKSRPVNVQTTYTADGTTRTFFGKKCRVEFDVPPAAQTHITITETKDK